jgi:hypothetical protein
MQNIPHMNWGFREHCSVTVYSMLGESLKKPWFNFMMSLNEIICAFILNN